MWPALVLGSQLEEDVRGSCSRSPPSVQHQHYKIVSTLLKVRQVRTNRCLVVREDRVEMRKWNVCRKKVSSFRRIGHLLSTLWSPWAIRPVECEQTCLVVRSLSQGKQTSKGDVGQRDEPCKANKRINCNIETSKRQLPPTRMRNVRSTG